MQINQTRHRPQSVRIEAFDMARGLAVLFMVLVHVLIIFGRPDVQSSSFGNVIDFLGGPPAAPVFMFLMGAFLALKESLSISKELRRGLSLFLLGYCLNLLRDSLPLSIALYYDMVTLEELGPVTPLSSLFFVDILQFAGIAYPLCVLLKRFCSDPRIWIITAFIVAFVSPTLWGMSSGFAPLDQVFRLLWGTEWGTFFPVFPWLTFPVAGLALGSWLKKSENHDIFFRRALGLGIFFLVVGIALTLTNFEFHYGNHYRSGPGHIIGVIGFVLVWLWFCRFVFTRTKPNSFTRRLSFWSVQLTSFYVTHWVIIGWVALLVGRQSLGMFETLAMIAMVAFLADIGTRIWCTKAKRLSK